jgi:hypothetical protein
MFDAAFAGQWAHCQIASILIKEGANLEVNDKGGKTALTWSVLEDRPQMTKLLIANGARTKRKPAQLLTLKSTAALDAAHNMHAIANEAVESERDELDAMAHRALVSGDDLTTIGVNAFRGVRGITGGSAAESRLRKGAQILDIVERQDAIENLEVLQSKKTEQRQRSLSSKLAPVKAGRRARKAQFFAAILKMFRAGEPEPPEHAKGRTRRSAQDLSDVRAEQWAGTTKHNTEEWRAGTKHDKDMQNIRALKKERRRETARKHEERRAHQEEKRAADEWEARRRRAQDEVDKERVEYGGADELYADLQPRGEWKVVEEWRTDRSGWKHKAGKWEFIEEPKLSGNKTPSVLINNSNFYKQYRHERSQTRDKQRSTKVGRAAELGAQAQAKEDKELVGTFMTPGEMHKALTRMHKDLF